MSNPYPKGEEPKTTRTPAQILADLDNAVARKVFVWPSVGAEAAALIRELEMRLRVLTLAVGNAGPAVRVAQATLDKFES